MKRMKRETGPSLMSGVRGVVVAVFGIFWTVGAMRGGLPMAYWLSGAAFVCITIGYAVYNFTNASGKTRYTEYHVVDEDEDVSVSGERVSGIKADCCPHCGAKKDETDNYCRNCGKQFA